MINSGVAYRCDRRPTRLGNAAPEIRKTLAALLIVFAALGSPSPALADPNALAGDVRIAPSAWGAASQDTTYEISLDACRIRWTISRAGVNRGVAEHRATCKLPLAEEIALNGKILDKVLTREASLRTLYLGHLKQFPDFSVRLAVAAAHSPDWDSKRGLPRDGKSVNQFVQELLTTKASEIVPELQQLFAERHIRVAVTGAEEVSIDAARNLALFPELASQGVPASDLVPYDCLIWFSITHEQ